MDFSIVERRWAMARSPIDNHLERSHNPATLTRQRDDTPCSERFPVPDAGRVRLQDSAASHGQVSACLGSRNHASVQAYSHLGGVGVVLR
jgi:hypothetical protein